MVHTLCVIQLIHSRNYFDNNRQPFAITVAGTIFYIITNPEDVTKVYLNSSTLSFDVFLKNMMKSFGSSSSAIEKLFGAPCPESVGYHSCKNLAQLAHDFQVYQTQGENMMILCAQIKKSFERNLLLNDDFCASPYWLKCIEGDVDISLKKFTAKMFIDAGQLAYFGRSLFDLDPSLPLTLMKLDDLSWQLFYQYPSFLCREMNAAKDKILLSLQKFFEMPIEKRSDQAWFTQKLEKEYRILGFNDKEIAAQMTFVYWGQVSNFRERLSKLRLTSSRINTNVSKVCFWMIAHMIFTPDLVEIIRHETEAAIVDGVLDHDRLHNSCPRLNGVWLEALRLSAASSTLRFITEDTTIGGKVLRRGNTVMISARQLHFNRAVFGNDASQFDSTRFLSKTILQRSSSFRPFGGGVTLCPGRFLAKEMIVMFIAIFLHRFNIDLAMPQRFPKLEERKPAIGIITGDDDLLLRLRSRNNSQPLDNHPGIN